jgi:hypothetical protein
VEMVRQLAEALAHAHRHRITHRVLTARSVLVRPAKERCCGWRPIAATWSVPKSRMPFPG